MGYLTLAEVEAIARRAHAGQVDKAGRPYEEHIAAVARGTAERGGDEEQVAAAWLHDAVEDDKLSPEWLEQAELSPRTKEIVRAMTRGEDEPLERYVARVRAVPGAATVKEADLAHNSDPERLAVLPGRFRARLTAKYDRTKRLLHDEEPTTAQQQDPGADAELLRALDPVPVDHWEALRRHLAEDGAVEPGDLAFRDWTPHYGPRVEAVTAALDAIGAVTPLHAWTEYPGPYLAPDGTFTPADAVRAATAVVRGERFSPGTVARAWQDGRLFAVARSLTAWYAARPERELAELRRAEREGRRTKYLFFWGHQPPRGGGVGPGCLSQWWPAAFTVDGVRYASAEHFMMASKARLFRDAGAEERILAARTAAEAKAIGRQVRGFDEETWAAHCFGAVVRGSVAKFGADAELRDYLLGTGSRVLVEAGPLDRVWGIGLAADDERAASPSHWRGRNLLGFALMAAREVLAAA